MKRYVFIFIFSLSSLNLFATQNANFDININKNVTISVSMFALVRQGSDYIQDKDGLYWDLLLWAKNVQNKLNNKTGNIFIFIDNLDDNIEISEELEGKYINIWKIQYKKDKDVKKIIFTALNTYFNIDVKPCAFSSVQVFLVNYEDSGLSVDKGIFNDCIFFTEEGAINYINEQRKWDQRFNEKYNYYIEKIVLTKKNVINVRFIS